MTLRHPNGCIYANSDTHAHPYTYGYRHVFPDTHFHRHPHSIPNSNLHTDQYAVLYARSCQHANSDYVPAISDSDKFPDTDSDLHAVIHANAYVHTLTYKGPVSHRYTDSDIHIHPRPGGCFLFLRHADSYADALALRPVGAEDHTDAHPNEKTHADTDTYQHSDFHTQHPAGTQDHSDPHTDEKTHADTSANQYPDSDFHSYTHTDQNPYFHSHAHTDQNSYFHQHLDADIYAYRRPDCYVHTHVHVDSYEAADANSHTYEYTPSGETVAQHPRRHPEETRGAGSRAHQVHVG